MIHDANRLVRPARIEVDVCVVGSGPGGAAAAAMAVEAGHRVLVLEAGGLVLPTDMNQREEDMLPRLLWHAGARTTVDRAVHVHQGRGVGGSSLHNLNLCKRVPEPLLRRWIAERGLRHLPFETWSALYDEVERRLSVTPVPERQWNTHNRLLRQGCDALGWRGGPLRHNRSGCIGAGFCEIGCAYDAKNNALKVFTPAIVAGGGSIVTHCLAVRVRHRGGEVLGVHAVSVDPVSGQATGEVTVDARRVCLAASATGTPAILQRSDVPDPSDTTGRSLRTHPAVMAAGEFEDPVRAWDGIPQTWECTEHLDFETDSGGRLWIVPAFAHPMGFATMLPGHGEAHRRLARRYDRLAVFTAMLHDHTKGLVTPRGDLDVAIDYAPADEDKAELVRGLRHCTELLLAAGATKVYVPTDPYLELTATDSLSAIDRLELTPDTMDLTAVHPMASVPMGDDPARAAVGSDGKHHHLDGLWIADGSLFPTSIGVPPQLSIYAMGLHVGRHMSTA